MKAHQFKADNKFEINLTSMIDLVFLLMVFFIMTFKIGEQEGDFSIRMPLVGNAVGIGPPDTELPLKLRLRAAANGDLAAMQLNEVALGTSFPALHQTVIGLLGNRGPSTGSGDGPEVEIDTDYNLRYEYVIEAITAVSGFREGNQTVPLIDKIKFAPPRH